MRKILITEQIWGIAEEYRTDVLKKYRSVILRSLKSLKNKMIAYKKNSLKDKVHYVELIIQHLDDIILMTPDTFEKPLYGFVLNKKSMSRKINASDKKSFADQVVAALHYDKIRKDFIPSYIKKLGIRTCVYCNANWAITFNFKTKNSHIIERGYYEIDHFKPKCFYPHLCISFFNLQPSCGGCNNTKSKNGAKFNLYEGDADKALNPFIFEIDESSLIDYYMNHNSDSFHISFHNNSKEVGFAENHNDIFHIEELYQAFTPEVEELIWKFKTYNNTYVKSLVQSFEGLLQLRQGDIQRLLYGFYQSEEDIHKRPLTKLYQDIFKQLLDLQKGKKGVKPCCR